MALNDKKKPYQPGVLPGAKLIPGSTAANIADAVGGFKANYNAKLQTGEQQRLANNLNFIDPANPASMKVAPPAVQRPTMGSATAPSPPVAAKLPMPNFANVAGGSTTSYGPPANPARRPGSQAGAGAPSAAGTAALRPGDPNTFTGTNGVTRPVPGTMAAASNNIGSVATQNFGNPVVPQPQAGIARPGAVASTLGQSVRTMPDDNVVAVQRPNVAVRGADQMAEQYNSREDREAARTLAGNLDTDVFRASFAAGRGGRAGRQAQETIAALRGQQAAILGGQSQLSAGAVQGRAGRDNQFGIAEMGEQGDQRRAELDAMVTRDGQQVTREGQQLDYNASMIEKPTLRTDRDGNLLSVAGTAATNVVDAQGNPVREQVQQVVQPGQITPETILKSLDAQEKTLSEQMFNATPEAAAGIKKQLDGVAAQRQQLIAGAQPAAAKPSQQDFLAKAKQANPGASEADLIAYYNQKYGAR